MFPLVCSAQWELDRYVASNCSVWSTSTTVSQLKCELVPGIGTDLYWTLTIGRQRANSTWGPTSYGRPIISSFAGLGAVDASTEGFQVRMTDAKPRVAGRSLTWVAVIVLARAGAICVASHRRCLFSG